MIDSQENELVFCGLALGYALGGAPINQLYTERAPLEDVAEEMVGNVDLVHIGLARRMESPDVRFLHFACREADHDIGAADNLIEGPTRRWMR